MSSRPSSRPSILIIDGQKGGVGKTTFARIELARRAQRGIVTDAYDADGTVGNLFRFYPQTAMPVDLTDAMSAAVVLDRLLSAQHAQHALVDLGAGTKVPLQNWLEYGGILDAARDGEIGLTLVFLLGNTQDSVSLLRDAYEATHAPNRFLLVRNAGVSESYDFWEGCRTRVEMINAGAVEVTIPRLDQRIFELVDRESRPFPEFIDAQTDHRTASNWVKKWLNLCCTVLDNAGGHLLPGTTMPAAVVSAA